MVKQTIQIFARVKPTKAKIGPYDVSDSDGVPIVSFSIPKDLTHEVVNNKKELYKFKFQKIFDQQTKQDEVFENVAKPVINSVLQGYNGTIFAYGQTGSGKTFTITGGAEKYTDRGLIPRILSYVFDYYQNNTDQEFSTHVSYLEIYNDNGYDLLDPKHEAAKLEDLPKVTLMEDTDQNIHLKNLSTHQAGSEEEALNLLFLGDTNRMIAETPMNQASTRSHCIFTIHITSREPGSATVRRAKLHLVDLAGSERVGKTGVNGTLLTEAKYINLSLHYLEQVIVALGEKSRAHIPYRNSMMTSVLRDSLGGNCKTTMIATLSVEKKNIDESISTCRFAQRVALIKNDAILNEELDPKLMILRLKKEIQELKDELAMATGEMRTDDLSQEDLERCQEAVQRYLEDSDPDCVLNCGADMRKINKCFSIMKQKILISGHSNVERSPDSVSTIKQTPREPAEPDDPTEIIKMKGLLQQRDNEINILVNMLKKEKKRAADAISALERQGQPLPRSAQLSSESDSYLSQRGPQQNGDSHTYHYPRSSSTGTVHQHSRQDSKPPMRDHGRPPTRDHNKANTNTAAREREERAKAQILGDMSLGRQEAFEIFRRDYEHNQTIEDNKALLKQRYAEAKSHGERVNQARSKINKLKASIEQHRMSRVMQGLVDPNNPEPDDMEIDMRQEMEDEKNRYKETFKQLRSMKTEIEHLQHLLERSKVKLMKDFELWWAEQATAAQEQQQAIKPLPTVHTKAAWRTPPITPNKYTGQRSQPGTGEVVRPSPSHSSHSNHSNHGNYGKEDTDTSGYSSSQDSMGVNGGNRTRPSKPLDSSSSSSIPLTGDAQADADIMAFVRARQQVIRHSHHPR